MRNITLALAIALGFCATEAEAQAATRGRPFFLGRRNIPRPGAAPTQPDIVLFDAQKAVPYVDAVEKAKENDPEAYYWLSYYFSKGGEVDADGRVAWKFLLKSEELGWPEASRTMGRVHEVYSLQEGRNSYSEFSFTVDYSGCKQFENSSLTNELATSGIESYYDRAFKAGVTDATNDLVRLQKKIADVKARIEKEKDDRRKAEEEKHMRDENTAKALALLPPEKPKEEVQQTSGRSNLLGGRLGGRNMGSLRERRAALREQQREAEQAEFEALIANGGAGEKLKQLEEETVKSRAIFEKMLALEEKSKTLSADALEIYKKRLDVLRREYETSSNRLACVQSMLTPEKIAEFEKKKKAEEEEKVRKQKAKAEYMALAADVEHEIEKSKLKEREETQKKLAEMAEELMRQREEAAVERREAEKKQ